LSRVSKKNRGLAEEARRLRWGPDNCRREESAKRRDVEKESKILLEKLARYQAGD
jgi:hypothetical protein